MSSAVDGSCNSIRISRVLGIYSSIQSPLALFEIVDSTAIALFLVIRADVHDSAIPIREIISPGVLALRALPPHIVDSHVEQRIAMITQVRPPSQKAQFLAQCLQL